jgi:hypothetical protein
MVPLRFSATFTLAPSVGLALVENVGTTVRVGVVPRLYLSTDRVAPYVTARVGALLSSPDDGVSTTDILAGVGFGGEYFLQDQFSLGVEAQLNAAFSDENSIAFGSPGGMTINTAMGVFASVYF